MNKNDTARELNALLKPEIVKVVVLKSEELGQKLSAEQVETVIKSLIWMQESLLKWEKKA